MVPLLAANMSAFLVATILGVGLFLGGLSLGLWSSRRRAADAPVEKEQVLHMLADLFAWTSDFSQHVSSYRDVISKIAERRGTTPTYSLAPDVPELLNELLDATKGVEQRLTLAETSLKQHAAQIATYMSEARTDALTGLPNRRAFDEDLSRRFAEWRRHNGNLSLLLIDIDHFKSVNDRFGHLAGDAMLRQVSDVLRATLRESDIVCRFGGEEFAVVLPQSDAFEGCQAARRAREAIEKQVFSYDELALRITISCGVAQAGENDSPSTMLKRTDQALYASKHAGRNCVHWHDGTRCLRTSDGQTPETPPARPVVLPDEFADVCQDLRRKLQEVTAE